MGERATQARRFLRGSDWAAAAMVPLAGDASVRRYFRLVSGSGHCAVLMDAPPGAGADIAPFLAVARYLRGLGLAAPEVYAADCDTGFILMEDLGDALFVRAVNEAPQSEAPLYEAAADVLAVLHAAPAPDFLPRFTRKAMCEAIAPVYDWYRRGLAGDAGSGARLAFQAGLESVFNTVLPEDERLMLRDFHAENLIWLPGRHGTARVGLLDFQDAMTGPAGYDLVSLVQDARRDVSAAVARAATGRFVQATGQDAHGFAAACAAIGAQRNLRILGVFARLAMEQGKLRYLDFIPRVWGHVQACLAHPALAELAQLVQDDLPAPDPDQLQRLKDRCPTLQTQ